MESLNPPQANSLITANRLDSETRRRPARPRGPTPAPARPTPAIPQQLLDLNNFGQTRPAQTRPRGPARQPGPQETIPQQLLDLNSFGQSRPAPAPAITRPDPPRQRRPPQADFGQERSPATGGRVVQGGAGRRPALTLDPVEETPRLRADQRQNFFNALRAQAAAPTTARPFTRPPRRRPAAPTSAPQFRPEPVEAVPTAPAAPAAPVTQDSGFGRRRQPLRQRRPSPARVTPAPATTTARSFSRPAPPRQRSRPQAAQTPEEAFAALSAEFGSLSGGRGRGGSRRPVEGEDGDLLGQVEAEIARREQESSSANLGPAGLSALLAAADRPAQGVTAGRGRVAGRAGAGRRVPARSRSRLQVIENRRPTLQSFQEEEQTEFRSFNPSRGRQG